MNALRWNPFESTGSTSTPYIINYSIGNDTGSVSLSLSTSSTIPLSSVTYELPYQDTTVCQPMTLTENGAEISSFPSSRFNSNSPLRPLCGTIEYDNLDQNRLGDVSITSKTNQKIMANSWFTVHSSVELPTGFSLISFTGIQSNIGQVDRALQFSIKNPITFETPQLDMSFVPHVNGISQIGALVYNVKNGNSWYLPATSWNEDPNYPFKAEFEITSNCTLIFGVLDNSINSNLPYEIGKKSRYIGTWGSKSFDAYYDGNTTSELTVAIDGSQNLNLLVDYPISTQSLSPPAGVLLYNITFPSSKLSTANNIIISKHSDSPEGTWMMYSKTWIPISSTYFPENSTISAKINAPGIYGLVYNELAPLKSSESMVINGVSGNDTNEVEEVILMDYDVVFSPQIVNLKINTAQSEYFYLSNQIINPIESDGYSVWELEWFNWPNILGFGQWEWYCPDKYCKQAGVWLPVSQQTIKQSWITMKALRWNPAGSISTTVSPFVVNSTLDNFQGSILMNLAVGPAVSASITLPEPPYQDKTDCPILQLKASGANSKFEFPYGDYLVNTPIRPLCGTVQVGAGSPTRVGDFVVTSMVAQTILVNGWVEVSDTVIMPAGFSPLTFTATKSEIGKLDQAVKITASSPIELITPQLQRNLTTKIEGREDIGALMYDVSNGFSWYLPAKSWGRDPNRPLTMRFSIQGSSTMIFGKLDNEVNSILPIQLGKQTGYVSKWQKKRFEVYTETAQTANLQFYVIGPSDVNFLIQSSNVLASSKETVLRSYSVGFFGQLGENQIIISTAVEVGYTWALYTPDSSAVGASWVSMPSVYENGTLTTQLRGNGIVAILTAPANVFQSRSERIHGTSPSVLVLVAFAAILLF
ncbi:hypothetical protein BC833DRAFT_594490 [Globomyces pollinis-pini]|nr:hypothetical protein BC833DRAFT_594490 [Globomyces pollinis-pini]